MKREELRALNLTEEQIDVVMKEHGKALTEAIEKGKTSQTELQRYQKGGDLYTDPEEIARLRNFEKETLARENKAKKTAALEKLFKGANASASAIKLLIKGTDLNEIELDEKEEIKGGGNLLKQAKADYADLFSVNGNAGVPQNPDAPSGGGAGTKMPIVG